MTTIAFAEEGYYAYIGIFFILGIIFALGGYIISWLLRTKPRQSKLKIYQDNCAQEIIPQTSIQFNTQYYIGALIYLIFNLGALFILPWAVVYRNFEPISQAFYGMLIFLIILIIGLVYECKKGNLDWN